MMIANRNDEAGALFEVGDTTEAGEAAGVVGGADCGYAGAFAAADVYEVFAVEHYANVGDLTGIFPCGEKYEVARLYLHFPDLLAEFRLLFRIPRQFLCHGFLEDTHHHAAAIRGNSFLGMGIHIWCADPFMGYLYDFLAVWADAGIQNHRDITCRTAPREERHHLPRTASGKRKHDAESAGKLKTEL